MSGMVSFQSGWQIVQRTVKHSAVLMLLGTSFASSVVYAQSGTQQVSDGQGQVNEKTWAFNFKETDIQELVRYVAKSLNKTIIIDPKVKGKVQVITSKSVNATEMYELFLSILEVHGFAAVQSGEVLRVIPSKSARTSPVPVMSGPVSKTGSSIITQVIQLENISAAKLIPVLRPLAPQQAHMAAYAPSNAIIISDTAANIKRIKSVIQKIDLSAVQKTEVIGLNHASSEDVVRMLEQLKKNDAAKGKAENKKLVIVADKRTNSVLISGDELERQRVKVLIGHIDTPLAQSGNVRVRYLNYAKAKDLSEVLTKVVQNMERMSGRDKSKSSKKSTSTIEADEGTNSLIITAEADVMQSLSSVISRLDIRRAQVLVEAIIVEVSANNADNLGLDWLFTDGSGGYASTGAGPNSIGPGVVGAVGRLGSDASSTDIQGAIGGVLSTAAGASLGVGRVSDDFSFNVVVNALKNSNETNVLSTPSLLTLDNEEASIVAGQIISYQTGSFSGTGNSSNPSQPFNTLKEKNVGVTLKITPHINKGDALVLEIEQQVSDLAQTSPGSTNPNISNREINTKVLTNDGQMIVLGGLLRDNVTETHRKVPLLGDIPILGALFRSNGTQVRKTHLLLFLRATIIRDENKMDVATADKYQSIRDEQLERYNNGVEIKGSSELPLMPEWQKQVEYLQEQMQLNEKRREMEKQEEAKLLESQNNGEQAKDQNVVGVMQ